MVIVVAGDDEEIALELVVLDDDGGGVGERAIAPVNRGGIVTGLAVGVGIGESSEDEVIVKERDQGCGGGYLRADRFAQQEQEGLRIFPDRVIVERHAEGSPALARSELDREIFESLVILFAFLGAVGVVASLLPAQRAARVNPAVVFRAE